MIAPQKLYQRIADSIAADIASGQYAPGSRLPAERDLADAFAVSRPTIREAMIALEIRGLVGARKGSGIYVSTTLPQSVQPAPELDVGAFELIEARTLFESEAAALAAAAIDEAALAELRALLDAMDHPERGDTVDADRRFHQVIAEATGNSLVASVIEMLWNVREQSPLCVHMFAQARRVGVTPRVNEHQLIVDALAARDPQAAREAMRSHLRRVTDDLLEATKLELIQKAQADFAAQRERVVARSAV